MRSTGLAAVLAGVAFLLTSTIASAAPAPADPALPDNFVRVGTIGTNAVYKIVNRHSGKVPGDPRLVHDQGSSRRSMDVSSSEQPVVGVHQGR
jgi:hypothetical protein